MISIEDRRSLETDAEEVNEAIGRQGCQLKNSVERRLAFHVEPVTICTCHKQNNTVLQVATPVGTLLRWFPGLEDLPPRLSLFLFSHGLAKYFHHMNMSLAGRKIQGGHAIPRLKMDISATFHEQLEH